jgi:molybdopterin-guanine dinucleotide biosynthesis protein MobB
MVKAIAFVGPSGSGKTELICRLSAWFQDRGLRVAVLKHTHKETLGDEGKDTWRYRQTGVRLVALAAPGALQITRTLAEEAPLQEILALMAPEADLILVEGYKSGPLPKVVLTAPGQDATLDYPQIIALVSPEANSAGGVPVFRPGQIAALGEFLRKFLGVA